MTVWCTDKICSPEDVAKKVILLFGAPALLVCIFGSILAVLAWKSFLQSAARYGGTAARKMRSSTLYWTTDRQRAFVKLVVASSGFIALTYVFAQLAGFVYVNSIGDRSIMKADHVDWHLVLQQALDYRRWNDVSEWAVVAAAGSILLLGIAHLAEIESLRSLITGLWTFVLGVGILGAGYLAIVGVCLGLAILLRADDAPVWLLVLVAIGAACLALLPRLAGTINDSSRRMYSVGRE